MEKKTFFKRIAKISVLRWVVIILGNDYIWNNRFLCIFPFTFYLSEGKVFSAHSRFTFSNSNAELLRKTTLNAELLRKKSLLPNGIITCNAIVHNLFILKIFTQLKFILLDINIICKVL